jgi:Na+-driven multidrug efflux pump
MPSTTICPLPVRTKGHLDERLLAEHQREPGLVIADPPSTRAECILGEQEAVARVLLPQPRHVDGSGIDLADDQDQPGGALGGGLDGGGGRRGLLPGLGLTGAMVALLAGYVAAAGLSAAALARMVGPARQLPIYARVSCSGFSTVNWRSTLASTGLLWVDTLLLGVFLSSADVGLYNVATRLITMATFVMPAVNSAFAPRIADQHHRGRTDSLRRVYAVAASWNVRLTVPVFAVLLAFPAELLSLFGGGFATAAMVTVILAMGKFISAATDPCGLMLDMSGRPAWSMDSNIGGLVANVLLNLWWIPESGSWAPRRRGRCR